MRVPSNDPRHFYYRNDGLSNQVSLANIAVTSAVADSSIGNIDPDWPHSWFSIRPEFDIPDILDTIVIDGYTQAGSRRNTIPALGPLDTVLKIELDGTNTADDGLRVAIGAENSQISGLAINRAGGDGIELDSFGGNRILCTFLGTDVSGTLDLGNRGNGLYLDNESNNIVGGAMPEERNLIAGNQLNGIEQLIGRRNTCEANIIGLDRTATRHLPNGRAGLFVNGGVDSPLPNRPFLAESPPASPEITVYVRKQTIGSFGGSVLDGFIIGKKFADKELKVISQNNEYKVDTTKAKANGAQTPRQLPPGPMTVFDLNGDGVTPNDPQDRDR